MANTFKFGNKQWYGKKGSVLAYNDENNNFKPLPFDFTRSSSATRVNKDGLIEVVGSDEPRVDYLNNADGHLLLEPSRTNYITYSDDFSQSAWIKTRVSINSNVAISPDGSQNADKLVESTDSGTHFMRIDVTSGSPALLSVFAKKGEETSFAIGNATASQGVDFDLENGIVSGTGGFIEDYGNGWFRCSYYRASWSDWQYFKLRSNTASYTGDGTSGIYIWGATFEQGSYATSYIPTSGSSVTRAAEASSQDVPTSVINSTQGTMYFEGSSSESNISYIYFLSLSDGTLNNRFEIRQSAAVLQFLWRVGGVYQNAISKSGIDITTNFKVAVRYSSTDVVMYYNGEKVGTITSPTLYSANTLDRIAFDEGDGGRDLTGTVKDVRLYDTPLTDSELQALTTL